MEGSHLQTDEQEYTNAVQDYSDMVYRIAFQCCQNQADAEDIMQNVFLKLYLHRGDFKDEEHRRKWLARVTANECRSLLRSPMKRRRVNFSALDNMPSSLSEDPEQTEVYCAVMELPERYRSVIYLYYYEEYPIREIAEILDIRETTVQTRLMRARGKLKSRLQKEAVPTNLRKEELHENKLYCR